MPNKEILRVDYLQKDSTVPLLPNLPILTSEKSGWDSIRLAYYQEPAWELPECYSKQHIIVIPTEYKAANNLEFASEGNRQTIHYDPGNRAKGLFGILPANLAYRLCWNVDVEFLHCYIEPSFISHIAHESVNPDRVELALELKKADPLVCQIGHALTANLQIDGVGSRFYADSMATALAAHLLRHYSTSKHHFQEHEDGLSSVKLEQAIEYINTHLSENLSLVAIATELEMSQYYFCRLFKRSTGLTPHQYLIQQRVERAKQLLKQPELTIAHIAIKCGFANQSHLAKQFRQHTGLTPKQFCKI
ncbi:MAG: AraC family transcriptional regulator [Phormidesmis sp. CAN_BIN36]|nr:AraC family transcriptional regulator [Phormidesmis sp. CAN_BIN36]